jgi:AcrR family transcriptional regulator
VFWRRGYEGATLPDLTEAMGINRYAEGPAGYMREALEEPTSRGVAERLLRGSVELLTDRRNPRGCLLVHGALACGEAGESVRRELVARRQDGEATLRDRFDHAITEGDLPTDSDPADLARYVVAVVHGMAVQAASGASREQLQRVADLALRAWPT